MAARRAYWLFSQNTGHPSLRFKKLGGYEKCGSMKNIVLSENGRATLSFGFG
jgi:hypothetical protein